MKHEDDVWSKWHSSVYIKDFTTCTLWSQHTCTHPHTHTHTPIHPQTSNNTYAHPSTPLQWLTSSTSLRNCCNFLESSSFWAHSSDSWWRQAYLQRKYTRHYHITCGWQTATARKKWCNKSILCIYVNNFVIVRIIFVNTLFIRIVWNLKTKMPRN